MTKTGRFPYWVKTTSNLIKEISVLEDSTKHFPSSLKMAADRVSGFRVGNNAETSCRISMISEDHKYHITC